MRFETKHGGFGTRLYTIRPRPRGWKVINRKRKFDGTPVFAGRARS